MSVVDHTPEQPLLPLDMDQSDQPDLRAAFADLEISRRLSFEQAMADPALAIGIRGTAEAIARRRRDAPKENS